MQNPMLFWNYTHEEINTFPKDTVIVQPIGSVEQHGPHLPVATDSLIVQAFCEKLQQVFEQNHYPALFLPLLPYGKSNEHLHFPGTITFSANTLMQILLDIATSVRRAGFHKLVFLNGHGGNQDVLNLMAREIRIETGLTVFTVHPLMRIHAQEGVPTLCEAEAKNGIHAGQVETAILLHIANDLVRQDKMKAEYPVAFDHCSHIGFTGPVPFSWMAHDLSKSGVFGDPTLANEADGEAWINQTTTAMYELFKDILQYMPQSPTP